MTGMMIRNEATVASASWFLASARERLTGILDPGSFVEFLPPSERVRSPHLAQFDLPAAFDDGMIVGRGRLDGRDVLVAAQEGQFMGGTFAEVSGGKLLGLIRAAIADPDLPRSILLLLDSGGVRLQEANAGELAVAEVMRAIVEARSAGVAVVALVGGRAGAFGGAGLTAATCSRIAISEQGRLGVTGPEVIETNQGVEEFDSQDKALVWSVTGGRSRRLIGGADAYAEDTMTGFRAAALALLDSPPPFDLLTLQAEQERLAERHALFGACESAVEMWGILGIADPEAVRDMDDAAFVAIAAGVKGMDHDAR
ncbi:biotin-independent malonate decarboxylase subunit beta [Azospirillum rugosum]|uniref:Malonate decarboxylase beta subunit n=1 Tax=Azospirillum rugosum TaxID=416170 RepID=A0ABS4SL53_9PROT|nr:biotin-independent malonate decarboxylase subunit beta [Azospirillum rugosum]MBP2293294.1 malonate decarboxylase beta subunit [Azospirillum rugosum]